jgi:hypothetical protein
MYYWPPSVQRVESLAAFEAAFSSVGYTKCNDGQLRPGFEKVAVYVDAAGKPTHAARQLDSGAWTSKLGEAHDIQHRTQSGLEGATYGHVALYMERPSSHSF